MPLKASQLPADFRALWDSVKQLQRDIRELRAARTLEKAAVGAGGLTIQDPTSVQRMFHTPRSSRTFSVGAGLSNPPAIEFWSGLAAETRPGVVTAFEATGTSGPLPTLIASTGDVGNGIAYLLLTSGDPSGTNSTVQLSAGSSTIFLNDVEFIASLGSGGGIVLTPTGGYIPGENWNGLTLNNGWTSAALPWTAPQYIRRVDGAVQLIGSMLPGTLTAGTVIATLPSAYVIGNDLEFRVPGGSSTAYADLVIHGTNGGNGGQITITNIAGTITRISLSDIRIPF